MVKLQIRIIEARDVVAADVGGTSDPYVIVKTKNSKHKTKVIKKSLNPTWNETATLDVTGAEETVHFTVYDRDLLRDDTIGTVDFPLTHVLRGVERDMWLKLEAKSGELHIAVTALDFGLDPLEWKHFGMTRELSYSLLAPAQNKTYILGGENASGAVLALSSFQLANGALMWNEENTSGTAPPALSGAFGGLYGKHLVVVGGYTGQGDAKVYSNTVYVLSTETMEWKVVEPSGEKPSPRAMAASAFLENKLYCFGGQFTSGDTTTVYEELYILEIDKASIDIMTWTKQDTTGEKPLARTCLTASFYKQKLYIYGGMDHSKTPTCYYEEHAWVLDPFHLVLGKMTWKKASHTGMIPRPKLYGHSGCIYGKNLFLFGGCRRSVTGDLETNDELYVLDLDAMRWVDVKGRFYPSCFKDTYWPKARLGHSSCVFNNNLLLVGGQVPDKANPAQSTYLNDIQLLDLRAYESVFTALNVQMRERSRSTQK